MFRVRAMRGLRLSLRLKERCLSVAIAVLLLFICISTVVMSQRVTSDEAVERFTELSGGQEVMVEWHSNNWPIAGDPQFVIFGLMIDGQQIVGECEDRFRSEIVCRLEGFDVAGVA